MSAQQDAQPQWFDAFIKSAQYIVRLKSQQDVWEHLAKLVVTYFPAGWVAFAQRDSAQEISIHHSTLPGEVAARQILSEGVRTVIGEVLDSGFLASHVVATPTPSMTVLLPIVEEYQTKAVMLIGHQDADPLPKELLDVYLAVAGLAGTAFERLASEHELNQHRARLEELVTARTAELAQAKRQNDLILNSVREGICGVDLEGRIMFVNPFAAKILGWEPSELIGRSAHNTFHHTRPSNCDYPAEACLVHRTLTDGEMREATDEEFFRRDGTRFPVEFRTAPLMEEGKLVGAVIVFQDITDRKQAEAERQKFVSLADQSMEFIGMCDMNFTPFYINEAGRRLVGLDSLDQALHTPVKEFFFREDQQFIYEEFFPRVLREGVAGVEIRFRHFKTGKPLWMIYNVFYIRDAEGKPVGLGTVSRNITDRKLAEDELKAAKNSAEQAKAAAELANRAKDHFLAVLSHELRTPLTPVVMGISMLQGKHELASDVRDTLDMVRRNVEMEARLIDDLLDVTRIARGKIELSRSPVELCTVINRAVEVCKPDIEARGLHFEVDRGPSAPYWIEADAARLQQVFWNLLKNAIKFTPHGGCVGIRCRPEPGYVVAEVNDSGIGIDTEALPRIFNAFEQAERSITRQFGGLGLGLTISKALVEMHGGTIEAHSEGRGKGATFRVRLPLTAPAGQPEAPRRAAPPQRVLRPLRVLLVEDHGVTAQMMQLVLTSEGHTVERAGDVATALELAGQHDFDLLLSDLGLPDGSGHDLMRELRSRGYAFPAIALSGYGQEDDIQRSLESGFATHLTKPASREAVVEAVASVAGGQGAASSGESPTTLPSNAPVFDVQTALKRCLGKQDLLAQMMQFFFDDVEKLSPQIRSALQQGDLAEVGRLGHRLKGTISHLAAEPAREAALRVEGVGQGGFNQAEAQEAVRILEQECQRLKIALAEHRATTAPTQDD